jgi:RecB family exonuclease
MTSYSIIAPDDLHDTPHMSISQLRLLLNCAYAWKLRYHDRLHGTTSSAAWFGTLVHRMVAMRYRGLPFPLAHAAAWEEAASRVVPLLEQLPALYHELDTLGGLRTMRGNAWYAQSDLPRLLDAILDYQHQDLADLRWNSRDTLANYYVRSQALLAHEERIFLPGAFLVEGEPLTDTDLLDHDSYKLLQTELDGETLVGVPDVVAREPDGTIVLADYKTGRALATDELNEDAQLAFYVLLLGTAGMLADDAPYRCGHIYLHGHDVRQVWADTTHHDQVVYRLRLQVQLGRAIIRSGIFAPAKSLFGGFASRCATCDLREHCQA